MDTRLKKSRLYSTKLKALAVIAIILCAVLICRGMLNIIENSSIWGGFTYEYSDYTDTREYKNILSQYIYDTVNTKLLYIDEDNIRSGAALDKEIVLSGFFSQYSIPNDDQWKLAELIDRYNTDVYTYLRGYDELDINDEMEKYEKYISDYDSYKMYAINAQLNDYKLANLRLAKYKNIGYYLQADSRADDGNSADFERKDYFNTSLEKIISQDKYTVIDGSYINGIYIQTIGYSFNNYAGSAESILEDRGYTLYAGAILPLEYEDELSENWANFDAKKADLPVVLVEVIIGFAVIIALFAYLAITAGQTEKGGEVVLKRIDNIFADVQTLIVIFAIVMSVSIGLFMIGELNSNYAGGFTWIAFTAKVVLYILVIIDMIILMSYTVSISRLVKARKLVEKSLVAEIGRKLAGAITRRSLKGWIVLCMCLYWLINTFFITLIYNSTGSKTAIIVLIIIFNILSILFCVRAVTTLSKIMKTVREISKGNLNYKAEYSNVSGTFEGFAGDVELMQERFKDAVKNELKGEKMRMDLITNVSHDLKTPLTSIITYVDLLKNEKPCTPNAENYINILDEKANKLKQLIQDLIEASKLSSGNISVDKTKVDFKMLLLQAAGECEDSIVDANLSIKYDIAPEDIKISADGKHMWRILDNLFSNAVKYSMPNTRIHIELKNEDEYGVLTMKNISINPLDVKPENLTERFVRGDQARSTEGSGLGLSIAKSLAEIQGGAFEIEIDGDVFKAILKMPLWQDE